MTQPDRDPARDLVERLTRDLLPLSVLFAAVELRLFDALDQPRELDDLAARIGVGPDAAARLCRALSHLSLVTFEGSAVAATQSARETLGSSGARSLAPLLVHQHRQLLPPMLRLADALRTGRPQHAAWPFAGSPMCDEPYDELAKHPEEVRAFLAAMDAASRGVGAAIAASGAVAGVERLLDLGGGGGVVARELLSSSPSLVIESLDLPAAIAYSAARSAEEGLTRRHVHTAHDLRAPLVRRGFDAVLLSAVLADWPPAERAALLLRARGALRPRGLLLVSETLLDDDRRGPPKAALLSLVMLAAMRGDQLSAEDLVGELARAGFEEIEVRRMEPRDLVLARAPAGALHKEDLLR